jgi:hypothetical protein
MTLSSYAESLGTKFGARHVLGEARTFETFELA